MASTGWISLSDADKAKRLSELCGFDVSPSQVNERALANKLISQIPSAHWPSYLISLWQVAGGFDCPMRFSMFEPHALPTADCIEAFVITLAKNEVS